MEGHTIRAINAKHACQPPVINNLYSNKRMRASSNLYVLYLRCLLEHDSMETGGSEGEVEGYVFTSREQSRVRVRVELTLMRVRLI
jgi:hypothetical protein